MDCETNLEELLEKLAQVGELRLGHGPRHLDEPNHALEAEVKDFLEKYPFLRRDPGYVAFLERYAGGVLWREDDVLSLGLFGFYPDLSTHLVSGPGNTIEYGFLTFCDMVVPKKLDEPFGDAFGLGFGFEATGQRPWGIYRIWAGGAAERYCDTFLDWLERFVELEGRLVGEISGEHAPDKPSSGG